MIVRDLPLSSMATWILTLRMASGKSLSFREGLEDSSIYLRAQTLRCFDEQRSPDGRPWAPLKRPRNRLRDRRARKKNPHKREKILVDTALLQNSTQGGTGFTKTLGDLYLTQGTNIEYAHFHQFGTRKMVDRPFTGITAADGDKVAGFIADDVARQLVKRL